MLDAEGKAFVGFTAASDGDGAVHELLDWRLSALESATQGRAAPQQEQFAAGTRTASYQLYPSTVGRSDSALSQSFTF